MSLSQTKKKRGGVPFRLTDRDLEIIRAVNRYRYLRTGQIHRLIFKNNTSIQSARRRLKLLFHNGYLGRIHPFLQQGRIEQSADVAYYLGRAGQGALEEFGDKIPRYSKTNQVRHKFLLHALDLSEFRLNLEIAVEAIEGLEIKRFIPYFEMKEGITRVTGKHRYRLYDEIRHPISGEVVIIFPDAAIILHAQEHKQQRLIFVEIDRGTEGLEKIRQKLVGYHWYAKNRIFAKYGSFDKFSILFQTSMRIPG